MDHVNVMAMTKSAARAAHRCFLVALMMTVASVTVPAADQAISLPPPGTVAAEPSTQPDTNSPSNSSEPRTISVGGEAPEDSTARERSTDGTDSAPGSTTAKSSQVPDSQVPDSQEPGSAEAKSDDKSKDATDSTELTMSIFLDRLMQAESGGRANARNSRSTAFGAYQFIASTWLMIANKHFTKETKGLHANQILALRKDIALSRRAAEIYTHLNAAHLVARGHKATFPNLRLAYLVGPSAAVRVLSAPAEMSLRTLLGSSVIGANPFMARLSAQGLIARAARDVLADPGTLAGVVPDPALVQAAKADGASPRPNITAPCDLSLPSCRRWLALAQRRAARKQRQASR